MEGEEWDTYVALDTVSPTGTRDGLRGASPRAPEASEESGVARGHYTAKEDRGVESHYSEGRERRTADTLGGIRRARGRRRRPLEEIYRQLFNRNLSRRA